ncbi:ATP-dependent Clp protease adapter ClpS [Thorsellia kenyensis]|uniref:ATP-dependent Clp protease adapter protein ClpS n=1 Tax=Thorsellia kenyensis TaxID=1549888 RepID=A0ABV6CD75_9GAMM
MSDILKKILGDIDSDTITVDEVKEKIPTPPGKYDVILLNDDFTPMDFVIDVLMHFFHHPEETAINLMLKVHNEGSAVCGTYTAEIAESKVLQVNQYAKSHEHPLKCDLQKHL